MINPEGNFNLPEWEGRPMDGGLDLPEQVRPDKGLPTGERRPNFRPSQPKHSQDRINRAREAEKRIEALRAGARIPQEREPLSDFEIGRKITANTVLLAAAKKREGWLIGNDGRIDPTLYGHGVANNLATEKEKKFAIKNTKDDLINQTADKSGNEFEKVEKGLLAEKAVFLILNRIGINAVGTAKTDDYLGKVDIVALLSMDNGSMPMAFDVVLGAANLAEKKKKVALINEKGGAEIDCGVTVRDGKIAVAKNDSVPVFHLLVNAGGVAELARDFDLNNGTLSPYETKKRGEILASAYEQVAELREKIRRGDIKNSSFENNLNQIDTQLLKIIEAKEPELFKKCLALRPQDADKGKKSSIATPGQRGIAS